MAYLGSVALGAFLMFGVPALGVLGWHGLTARASRRRSVARAHLVDFYDPH